MKVPISWLKDYVDINLPLEELARRMTLAGHEVGEIITTGGEWNNVVVGRLVGAGVGAVAVGVAEGASSVACACIVALTMESISACCAGRNTAWSGGWRRYLIVVWMSARRRAAREWTGGR